MSRPNILLIVWDAFRNDYIGESDTLVSLADDNVSYESAIAPATWSLPSHVSLFTGIQAHEHGVFDRTSHEIGELELVDHFLEGGYRTYGVSANPFASPHFDFDASFDEFYYTNGVDLVDPSGIDASEQVQDGGFYGFLKGFREAIIDDHRTESLANLAHATAGATVEAVPALRRVPHKWLAWGGTFGYSYRPNWNTERIEDIFQREANRDGSFFLFTNYMDPHHPYLPSPAFVDSSQAASLGLSELYELNEKYGQPWTFLKNQLDGEEIPEEIVQTLRTLYAEEIRSLDNHLSRILKMLERQELLEETVIVVTADHGELLGERDCKGRRRIGHEATVNDSVTHVPLVVAHPSLPAIDIDERVSLLNLPEMLKSFAAGVSEKHLPEPSSEVVTCLSPGHGGEEVFEAFDLPHELLASAVSTHTAAGYFDGWKVVVNSTDTRYAKKDGDTREISEAPSHIVKYCEQAVSKLVDEDDLDGRDLDTSIRSQLQDMGYL